MGGEHSLKISGPPLSRFGCEGVLKISFGETVYVRMSRLGYPPWILKQGGLDSSGQRLISSIGKTERFFFLAKKTFFINYKFFENTLFFLDFFFRIGLDLRALVET